MSEQEKRNTNQAARVYLRVSTDEQDLARQEAIVTGASSWILCGSSLPGKGIGRSTGPARTAALIADLQAGEVVVAEKIDRISRLPLPETELLVATIGGKELGSRYRGSLICPTSLPMVLVLPGSCSRRCRICCYG
ncbi:recombinase family protein [Sphingomonas aerolata]|uniref:recombinase family protein n=1 Tax=Sphingomonas aerolata TaxID=185951 RepID=UPI003A5C4E07